jgi:hypothetical protein
MRWRRRIRELMDARTTAFNMQIAAIEARATALEERAASLSGRVEIVNDRCAAAMDKLGEIGRQMAQWDYHFRHGALAPINTEELREILAELEERTSPLANMGKNEETGITSVMKIDDGLADKIRDAGLKTYQPEEKTDESTG